MEGGAVNPRAYCAKGGPGVALGIGRWFEPPIPGRSLGVAFDRSLVQPQTGGGRGIANLGSLVAHASGLRLNDNQDAVGNIDHSLLMGNT